MPITTELHNTRELREVGFSQAQGEKLAEIFQRSQQRGFEKFAETLEHALNGIRAEISGVRSELREEIKALRVKLHSPLRDQMLKFITILVAVVPLAVAVIKLFPDVG